MLCTWEMGSEKKEGTMGCVICTFEKRCSTFHFHASTPLLTLRMLIFFCVLILVEEKLLLGFFAKDYQDYRSRTITGIPFIK